jgi:methyl-accepting chemotaxis protein
MHRALLPELATPDRAALDSTLASSLLLNADLVSARLDYAGGHLETLRTVRTEREYPAWFGALGGLTPLNRTVYVGDASLALSFEPARPLTQVWRTLRQQAIITIANVTIIYTLLAIIIFVNKRMLRRLAEATSRFQNGDYGVRLPNRGTLETRALATTFNNMAERVQALVLKLQLSQSRLSEQLERTLQAQEQLQMQKDRIEVTLASIGDAVIPPT